MSQGPLLKFVDFVDDVVSCNPKNIRANVTILLSYAVAIGCMVTTWHHFSDKDFSFLLTLAGCTQTLGFFLLLHKTRVQKSVAGISSKTLQVYVFVFIFRLSSTLVKNGYLPVDRTGDWVYQASDIASLLIVFQLLFFMHTRYNQTYQSELDTFPLKSILPALFLFGCCVHGNLNHSPFFDKSWTIGMWFDTVAMLPQLWMLVAKGGEVEALTSNFVALIFLSRGMAFWFWFTGYPELAPKDGGFNVVGTLIMTAHALQLLLSGDFMYHYFVWQANQCGPGCGSHIGASKGMVLPLGAVDV